MNNYAYVHIKIYFVTIYCKNTSPVLGNHSYAFPTLSLYVPVVFVY